MLELVIDRNRHPIKHEATNFNPVDYVSSKWKVGMVIGQ